MSRQAEVVKLDGRLTELKSKLDSIDITDLANEEDLHRYLTEIADA